MHCLYAVIITFIINKNSVLLCSGEVIRLNNIKFQVNGAPSVPQSYNYSATTPESVKESTRVSKQNGTEREIIQKKVTSDKNTTLISKNTIDGNKEKNNSDSDDIFVKILRPSTKKDKNKQQFKITIIKSETTTEDIGISEKEISENGIETRRIPGFNVYVPISEDMNLLLDEQAISKGMEKNGLSLIDLQENILRLRS